MSSDLYGFGTTFHTHSSPDLVFSDGVGDLPFLCDPFPLLTNSPTDVAQENSTTLPSSVDPFSPSFFSFSPPSAHLENLTLYHHANNNRVHALSSGQNLANEIGSFSGFDGLEVKSEECQVGVDYVYGQQYLPHSYSGTENVSKYMQRSFSSNSFEGKPGFVSQPHCDALVDSPKFQSHDMSSPEDSLFGGQMRRVCSTGDLQNMKANHMSSSEAPLLEEPNFKVGRYSAEERKERISKYRAKRTQRNFNKTIKYACRKTLADNRPRIRGRFARNDEASEIPKPPRYEDEVDFWIEELRLHEELDDVTVGAEQYVKSYGASQFQYRGF
ncbi:two-component response regulator-like APRR5 [Abrus precatorius]|uniref:Two-component response regulator-like APRR5 n=1 Tax=Abrus precatorius TaxID=3816 RepID=A0A8B8KMK4_ABRPR|nr:two-component response regulator-like APRR5 [Abrus precatorius]